MITQVKLKNWRSHLDSELKFSSGTNALLGHMGAGKSTLLDSICFAFFGSFPTLQSKKLKLDDVLMKKPIEKDKAEVEVYFQIDNVPYSVKRIIEKKKGTTYSEIKERDKILESPNSQRVTEIIEKLLKVNYDLFSKAIYSEQNSLDYFLTLQKGQRMKKIDELLMIEKFEKARSSLVSLNNKINERLLAKQSTITNTDTISLQKSINEFKNSLLALSNEKELLKNDLIQITKDKNYLEREVIELKNIKENLEVLKREEKGISSIIQETSFALENLEVALRGFDKEVIESNLYNLKKIIIEFESLLQDKQKEYLKLQDQFSKSKAEVEFLRKEKIEKLQKDLEEKLKIKKEIEKLKKDIGDNAEKRVDEKKLLIEKLVGEIEVVKNNIETIQQEVNKLTTVGSKCPLCNSKLTDEKKTTIIGEKQFQIKSLLEKLEKSSEKKQMNEKELRNLEYSIRKLNDMVLQIAEFDKIKFDLENSRNIFIVLNESTVKLNKELADLSKELTDLQTKYKESNDKRQQFEIAFLRLNDYQTKKQRLEQLIKQRNNYVSQIEQIGQKLFGKDINSFENTLKQLIANEKEFSTKVIGITQLIEEKQSRFNDFEQTYNTVMKEKVEIEKFEKLSSQLKIFEKCLEDTQIQLRQSFVSFVNTTMNNIWPTLYPYNDFTGIRLAIEEGDYVLQLQSKEEWINVEGIVSGGERNIAALALRIAFALVLAPHLRIIMLDEPSHNLDEQAINELATTLRERIGEFIDQTFLITHHEKLEEAVTGNAYKLQRNKANDEPTQIIELI